MFSALDSYQNIKRTVSLVLISHSREALISYYILLFYMAQIQLFHLCL